MPGRVRLHFFAGSATSAIRDDAAPMLGCLPFWFRSVSAFDLSFVTTFISGSNILAIPSNPSSYPPWRWQSRHYLAVLPSEESSRATLSWELHTTKLLWSHVPIGYQWQNTEFCPNSIGQNGHPRDFVSHASLKFWVSILGNTITVLISSYLINPVSTVPNHSL